MTDKKKAEALQRQGPQAVVVPDYVKGATAETNEQFSRDQVKLPMLRVCQSGTPQRKRGEIGYLEGLNEGDLFNDLTGRNYGVGPLAIVKLKFWTNFIRFIPMEAGGGIVCRDATSGGTCPHPCPKGLTWRDGKKPECTMFFNYLFFLPEHEEVVWFSAKSTFLKPMRAYNAQLRLPTLVNVGDYAKVATLETILAKNAVGQSFFVPKPSGVLAFMPAEQLEALKRLCVDYRDVLVDTSRAEEATDVPDGDVIDAAAVVTAGTRDNSEDIPF